MNEFERLSNIQQEQTIKGVKPKSIIQKILKRLRDDHNLAFTYGKVTFNFDPSTFRSEAINYPELIKTMAEKYGLSFETPSIIKLAMQQDKEIDSKMFHDALSSDGLNFRHGLINYEQEGDKKELIIRTVNLHSQNILVSIDGSTEEAGLVAQKIIADIIKNQGLKLSWSDFKLKVAGISYSSATEINLGFDPLILLSNELNTFIGTELEGDLGYVMADKNLHEKSEIGDYIYRCNLDKLNFKISIFDKTSGSQVYRDFDIETVDRRRRGKGHVRVYSELASNEHLQALDALLKCFQKKSKS